MRYAHPRDLDNRTVLLSRPLQKSPGWVAPRGLLLSLASLRLEAYGRQMPTVYVRADPKSRTRFHRDPTCWQLTKPPSRGDHNPLVEVDLEECYQRPCRWCYPDAPRIALVKRYCPICDAKHACEHNGGVLVLMPDDGYHGRSRRWVWPDNPRLRQYQLV